VSIFSPAGSSVVTANVSGSTNPSITNVALAASTELGIALPSGVRQYLVKLRDANAHLQISFISGNSATTYLTIPRGNYYADSDLSASGLTLYVQTPSSGQTLEILTWT
jgi:hypothetical protein